MSSSLQKLASWISGQPTATTETSDKNPHFQIKLTDTETGRALPEYGEILQQDKELATNIDLILETAGKTDKIAQQYLTLIKAARLSLATALVHMSSGDGSYADTGKESSEELETLRKQAKTYIEETGNHSPTDTDEEILKVFEKALN